MDKTFFDAAPRADHQERDRQTELSVDYRLCHEAMGAGQESNRAYLATKYGRELATVGQLWRLGQELFARMDAESRTSDLYEVERALNAIGQDKDADYI